MTAKPATAARGPLAGIRILDLTAVVLGPVATQVLGDYGADIIKVEPPEGDLMRSNGAPKRPGMSSIFLAINRNKRSLAVDLKSPKGQAALRRLLPNIDVLVHNMRPAAIERLGFGYEAVARINPKIVYCLATGYGQDGPDAAKPAFDDVIQAGSGLAGLIGYLKDSPDYIPSLIADKTTGLALVNAVLAALLHRERHGEGQWVEVPMLETMTAFTMAEHLGGLTYEPPTTGAGYARLLTGGRKPAPTRDGHVAMLPYTSEHWTDFFNGAGRADLAKKYDFGDRSERNARIVELYADMHSVTRTMTTDECLAFCERYDIPATKLYPIGELPNHPHLRAVGLFERTEHPTVGPVISIRPPTRFSRTPAELRLPAPEIGQHSREILSEAGFDATTIEQLIAEGVVRQAEAPGQASG